MIRLIREYDYWVDTTDFAYVVPVLESIIKLHSFGSRSKNPKVKSVPESQDAITRLLENYKVNLTDYIFLQTKQLPSINS